MTRPHVFRFTDARRTILEHLTSYRYLRTSQFHALLGAPRTISPRAVRRLLRDFHAHGYLRRRMVTVPRGGAGVPFYEHVYWLSPAGLRLAADQDLVDSELPEPAVTSRNLAHDLAISDFHEALRRFAEAHGYELFWLQHGLKRGVNPDALFALTSPAAPTDANTAYYFLEVEHAGEGNYREGRSVLLRRLSRYSTYQGSAECRGDWAWFEEFRVLIVVRTEARRRNLLVKLSGSLPLLMFWIGVEGAEVTPTAFETPGESDGSWLD